MPERKSHVKSRLGCVQCKARRVKCDETRPKCGNCSRRQEECSYAPRSNTKRTPSPDSREWETTHGLPKSVLRVHLKQLELMHQYSTSTWSTLGIRQEILRLHGPDAYQIDVPRLALRYDYLLDTIYALTSLHLAYLRPVSARAYIEDATRYHTRALAATRESLAALSSHECMAMYYASVILGLIFLAFRVVDHEIALIHSPTETLTQLATMWNGTLSIAKASENLMDPAMYNMVHLEPGWDMRVGSALGAESQVFFDQLRARAKAGDLERPQDVLRIASPPIRRNREEAIEAHLEAIDLLHGIFHASDLEHSRVLAWLVQCPTLFMDALAQKQSLANSVVLLYSVAMRSMDDFWWAGTFRCHLVDELAPVVASYDAEMTELVNWVQKWTPRTIALAPIHTSAWAEDRSQATLPLRAEIIQPTLRTHDWAEEQVSPAMDG